MSCLVLQGDHPLDYRELSRRVQVVGPVPQAGAYQRGGSGPKGTGTVEKNVERAEYGIEGVPIVDGARLVG